MSVHYTPIAARHSYTRSRTPWILDDYRGVYGKLIHYISGGGVRSFGRTVRQEEVRLRHRRFLSVAAGVAAFWLWFYIF